MTEQQRVEELMKDRYMVIADYPASLCRLGDVLEIVTSNFEIWRNCRYGGLIKIDVPTFPAIFKKLEWYEERKESEMPKYVRDVETNEIYKIKKWDKDSPLEVWFNTIEDELGWSVRYKEFLPATESQYLNQNKNK